MWPHNLSEQRLRPSHNSHLCLLPRINKTFPHGLIFKIFQGACQRCPDSLLTDDYSWAMLSCFISMGLKVPSYQSSDLPNIAGPLFLKRFRWACKGPFVYAISSFTKAQAKPSAWHNTETTTAMTVRVGPAQGGSPWGKPCNVPSYTYSLT